MAEPVSSPPPGFALGLESLAAERPGAVFLRADLQVHTPIDPAFVPGPEPRGAEARMGLAREYLRAAAGRGIELVGITEHNDVSWVPELRRAAGEVGVHLLPGFEVESAEGVHVLCLFDPDTPERGLEDSLVGLGLTAAKRRQQRLELRSTKYFADLLAFVQGECGGICIAAHIESDKGLLAAIRQGARVDAWRTPALLAAQVSHPPAEITSGNGRIVRGEDPIYQRERLPGYVLTSDCRSLAEIGSASTWVKMDVVGVEGLRQAFLDPESRIAYDDPRERREGGHVLAVSWEGDFLDGVRFPVNPELNCLIGGKGTGKSTVIESIRYAFDLGYRTKEVERAATDLREHAFRSGSKVSVLIETDAPARTRYVVERTAPHPPVVRDQSGQPRLDLSPVNLVRPCIYGQKEIFGIAQDAHARLDMLDGFAADHLREVIGREAELLDRCRENAESITRAQRQIDDAEARLAQLPSLEEWRSRFRQAGFEDLLRVRRLLDREQRLFERAAKGLREREKTLRTLTPATTLESALDGGGDEQLPNADLIEGARDVLRAADERWDAAADAMTKEVSAAREQLEGLRTTWADRRHARTVEFDEALKALQAKMPDVDPEQYLDVERQIEELTPLRGSVKTQTEQVTTARRERARLLVELTDVRGEKHRVRKRAAERLNTALAGNLVVDLTYQGDRDGFVQRLADQKTGARSENLRRMVAHTAFTPADFCDKVRSRSLNDAYGLPAGQASAIERALTEATLLELEVVELPDKVQLLLDVSVSDTAAADYRPLDRLSPGQKSTAILLLVMLESKDPLIVDQPEDDLDNRFIYDDIVKRLKQAKPSRQFMIATHNANIPILGDGEQIIALDAQEATAGGPVAGFVRARGSIDASDVRKAAEQILEGGREAFALRRAKYEGIAPSH